MSFLGLSNSDELFLSQEDSNSINSGLFSLPTFGFVQNCLPQQQQLLQQQPPEEENQEEEQGEEFLRKIIVSSDHHQEEEEEIIKMATNEEIEDGFTTPTSLDHKIPICNFKHCPPAPIKPKSLSVSISNKKRKTSSSSSSTSLKNIRFYRHIDLVKEINLLQQNQVLPQDIGLDYDILSSKINKKVRSN